MGPTLGKEWKDVERRPGRPLTRPTVDSIDLVILGDFFYLYVSFSVCNFFPLVSTFSPRRNVSIIVDRGSSGVDSNECIFEKQDCD